MKTFIEYELKKYILNRKVVLTFVVSILLFLYFICTFQATMHNGWNMKYLEEKWGNAITFIQNREFLTTVMDVTFEKQLLKEYKEYVDEEMRSDEEIIYELSQYDFDETLESVLANRYNPMYSGFVFSDALKEGNNRLTQYFEPRFSELDEIPSLKESLNENRKQEPYNQSYGYLSDSDFKEMKELFEKNVINEPYLRGTSLGFDMLTSNMQFLPFVLGTLLVICFYGMFGSEKVKKTDTIILTSKEGKRKYIFSKITTVLIVCTVSWIVFQLTNLIACYFRYGLEGGQTSVYTFFTPSPYGFNYLELYLKQLLVSYMGTLTFGYGIALVSQLLRPIPTFTLSMVVLLITSWLQPYSLSGYVSNISEMMLLLPNQMMGAYNTYLLYLPYSIFGFSINLPSLTFMIGIGGVIIFVTSLYISMKYRQIRN